MLSLIKIPIQINLQLCENRTGYHIGILDQWLEVKDNPENISSGVTTRNHGSGSVDKIASNVMLYLIIINFNIGPQNPNIIFKD